MKPLSRRMILSLSGAALLGGGAWAFWTRAANRQQAAALDAAWSSALPAPEDSLRVYHLGHSLVGRDMPAMIAQLAGEGHAYESQLGWGTSLREHWEPDVPVNGFDSENAHPRFRPAREAVASGDYDAVILTEMVELRDAVRYHDSPRYLIAWADLARSANPGTRVYLYESWHRLDDPDGWLNRIDGDWPDLWRGRLMAADRDLSRPIRTIPAGRVMAAFVRRIEGGDAPGAIRRREDLFARSEAGEVDMIHLNDIGMYLVALTHYAVLYHRNPVGLPHALTRADGSPADAPDAATARLMQDIVWDVVRGLPETGVGS